MILLKVQVKVDEETLRVTTHDKDTPLNELIERVYMA